MALASQRTALRLVPTTTEQARPAQWFCGHCGAIAAQTPAPVARVCGDCNLGLLVEARAELVPQRGEPFLIVDGGLTVCALSAEAQEFLAVDERDAISRPVTELLAPADAEAATVAAFADTIMWAAGGDDEPRRLTVRPANVFGVRMPMRVGVCGPPRAALLVLE
ncbi:hypothetical protein [Conexibacter sp. CPCC 206217]|uniref:hypothetical protein n=1 Tax=Conexibacter sp. CPCC 206217 TaxID=3064574 RepID=UPI0027208CB3|nr:hypothetical protein [Conexibacter sp. CPCC 206217]MDO8211252.1 hypothetical protein [Conexibacter sp. CPCC 206217]